jgi:hypothetical protein
MTETLNGAVETGLRTLAILGAIYPRGADLPTLVLLDFLLVHSGDVSNGPDSLHPPSPLRAGEIAVRRALIENGIMLYRSRSLINQQFTENGIFYEAGDLATAFIDGMSTPYVSALRDRAEWVAGLADTHSVEELRGALNASLDRWREEFATLGSGDILLGDRALCSFAH